jgi:hypothetical protein
LSLHYEGNALDLVDTINEILGTNLKVKSKWNSYLLPSY